ncbi:hypothetical protein Peur_011875 [Populus x canadensis]
MLVDKNPEKTEPAIISLQQQPKKPIHARSRSTSRDLLVRERSRSHSLTEYKALSTRKRHHDMVDNDSDGERMSPNSRDLRHGNRDSLTNVDRESSVTYNKPLDGEDRCRNKISQDKERSREREREREKKATAGIRIESIIFTHPCS